MKPIQLLSIPFFLASLLVSILAPVEVFADHQIVLPNAGLTPENPFYFLDRLWETLRMFFTFNSEAKARLQITFAAERIAEIKVILETKGVEARGLDVAQNLLQAHLANVATILEKEKAKGKDVTKLASELDDEFEGLKSEFAETFKAQKQALEMKEDELKTKIKEARRVRDLAQLELLAQQLAKVKTQKELLEKEEENQEEALEREEERIEEEMEDKEEAEKAIREAEKEKKEVLDKAVQENVAVPPEALANFNDLLIKGKSAFNTGNYQDAKLLAKQAEKSLKAVEKEIEDLEEAKEKEEELREEQEEKEREAKEEEKVKEAEERLKEVSEREENIVQYLDSGFSPKELKVKLGDTVLFKNLSSKLMWPASAVHPNHTVYPGTDIAKCKDAAPGIMFDACKGLESGQTWSFKFNEKGNWRYHNHLNPSHNGTIIVE